MPFFHFHFRDGDKLSIDETGLEFDSLEQAFLNAFRTAQDIWGERLRERLNPLTCSFEITDGDGRLLVTLPFREVLDSCTNTARQKPMSPNSTPQSIVQRTWRAKSLADDIRQLLTESQHALMQCRQILAASRPDRPHRGANSVSQPAPATRLKPPPASAGGAAG